MKSAKLAQLLIEGPRVVLVEDTASPLSKETSGKETAGLGAERGVDPGLDRGRPADEKQPKIDKKIAVFLNRVILRIFSVPSLMSYLKDVVLFQDDEAQNGQCKIQLVFHRLPDEAHPQVVKLIAAPRDPQFTRFVDKGQARTGVELEVEPDDFGGEEYDYAF
jgi:hypothetical protein